MSGLQGETEHAERTQHGDAGHQLPVPAHGRARVLCTYHPSYLLRNPAAKKDVWDDMKFLFRDMGVEL